MELLQPWMLWGLTGVALPIAIHFWYQKKGEVIAWAASRWLVDESSLKHRGIRLHEILLLIIRCLLIILLTLLLSQPVLHWWENKPATERVHLVQPDASVVNNYRFEIENALKAGEKVGWISPDQQPLSSISQIPDVANPALYLQKSINKLATGHTSIYVAANQQLLSMPKIAVPGKFRLYSLFDSAAVEPVRYLELNNGKRMYVNPKSGRMEVVPKEATTFRFAAEPAHSGALEILINYKDARERRTVSAAVQALAAVYDLPFQIDEKATAGKVYSWILSDQKPAKTAAITLYLISGKTGDLPQQNNVVYIADSLLLNASDLVNNGRLPEWLGEVFSSFYRLNNQNMPISNQQMNALFEEVKSPQTRDAAELRRWLLLVFVLLTLLERWLTLRKATFSRYA
ncbi:BatA domain-containing protein [Dyadobacter crusticola]|uniref:BatA domain-containing protein n=1 Tax=Dyadobacter crusticola TaxID=292407 RepID=UPI0004E19455|nr:BatA domain-containing protein [Dyadobacter crusticola]